MKANAICFHGGENENSASKVNKANWIHTACLLASCVFDDKDYFGHKSEFFC